MRALAIFWLATGLLAQAPEPVQFGSLYCGAVRRSAAQVQTYCYQWPKVTTWVLAFNQLSSVPIGSSVQVSFDGECKGNCDSRIVKNPLFPEQSMDVLWCSTPYWSGSFDCSLSTSIIWMFSLGADGQTLMWRVAYHGSNGVLTGVF
jgi:hypothetical protein